jgi:hypothetical protein
MIVKIRRLAVDIRRGGINDFSRKEPILQFF